MYALGPNYFDSAFNKFDCIVIFGSIFEVGKFPNTNTNTNTNTYANTNKNEKTILARVG